MRFGVFEVVRREAVRREMNPTLRTLELAGSFWVTDVRCAPLDAPTLECAGSGAALSCAQGALRAGNFALGYAGSYAASSLAQGDAFKLEYAGSFAALHFAQREARACDCIVLLDCVRDSSRTDGESLRDAELGLLLELGASSVVQFEGTSLLHAAVFSEVSWALLLEGASRPN